MGLAVFRDISLLWLIFLTFIAVLPLAVLLFFAVRGMHRLRQVAKQYLPIAQEKAQLVADKTEEIGHQVANPFIAAHAKSAQVHGILNTILRRK